MVNTAFALMLVFADGYVGGHTTAAYLKSKKACETKGAQMAAQYAAWGHPASYSCLKTTMPTRRGKPEAHTLQTLPPG
jgi:hypothetical protein